MVEPTYQLEGVLPEPVFAQLEACDLHHVLDEVEAALHRGQLEDAPVLVPGVHHRLHFAVVVRPLPFGGFLSYMKIIAGRE